MDLYRCNVSYFPNKGEKVKRANRFKTPEPKTDKYEISQEKKCSWFQSSKMIKNYLQLIKEKLSKSFEGMQRHGLKKLHGKNGFDKTQTGTLTIIVIIGNSPGVKRSIAGGSITFGGNESLLRFVTPWAMDRIPMRIFSDIGGNLHDLYTLSFIGHNATPLWIHWRSLSQL